MSVTSSAASSTVTAGDVLNNLQHVQAASPLEFVQAALQAKNSPPVVEAKGANAPNAVATPLPTTQSQAVPPPQPEVLPTPSFQDALSVDPVDPFQPREVPPPSSTVQGEDDPEDKYLDSEDTIPEDIKADETKLTDFKAVRAVARKYKHQFKETRQQLEENQTKLQTLEQQLEEYKTGQVAPDKLREYEEKIAALQQYEKLYQMQLSPEYQEQYVAPLEQTKEKARALANDYQIDPTVFDYALQIEDKKELNAFLKREFGDEIAVLDARQIVDDLRTQFQRFQEVQQEPLQHWERIKQEHAAKEAAKLERSIQEIEQNTKGAWVTAHQELRDTKIFPELQYDPLAEEYQTVTKPIIDKAAQEYGKIVKALAANGLKVLPPDIAKILAKYVQLGQAAGVMAESRKQYAEQLEQIQRNQDRQTTLTRPTIGAAMPGVPRPAAPRGESLEDRVEAHAKQFLLRR